MIFKSKKKKIIRMNGDLIKCNQLLKVNSCELIGKGGFGKVYRHFYELDCKIYAIKKILLTEQSANNAIKEVRILSGLNHINIIRYFTSWIESSSSNDIEETEEDDVLIIKDKNVFFLCIKMEYCEKTLSQYLLERNNFNMNSNYIQQILTGVKYLHEHQIIHRDLKPDNILITHNNIIKITDFGLVQTEPIIKLSDKHTTYAGTYLYVSPEQYLGLNYSFDTDIYSLGIIIFEMCHLFKTDMERINLILKLKNEMIIGSYIENYEIILKMIGNQNHRPTINQIFSNFYQPYHNPHIICRDIIWEIILNVMIQI
jgi:serine/threonine protein kinase